MSKLCMLRRDILKLKFYLISVLIIYIKIYLYPADLYRQGRVNLQKELTVVNKTHDIKQLTTTLPKKPCRKNDLVFKE